MKKRHDAHLNQKVGTTFRFSSKTIAFLEKTARQKRPDWLVRNRADYEAFVLQPLQELARYLKKELGPQGPGYHFPVKGIGRLKRPSHRIADGYGMYRGWLTYSASTPRKSRFDLRPNLFFMIDPDDRKEGILVAGGLYMPSSRQLRAIREAIAEDASPFDQLFATREFARSFPGGFSDERKATRPPRGFDPMHPRMEWLKLQGYFVWRPYTRREFNSPKFYALIARDLRQVLRLNVLLDQVIGGRVPGARLVVPKSKPTRLLDRLESVDEVPRRMDF